MFQPDLDGSRRRSAKPIVGHLVSFLSVAALIIGSISFGVPSPAAAAPGSDFNAGNIISDAIFYDSGTMSEGQIQSFLNAHVPNCEPGYTCLKNYSQATASQSAKGEGCAGYPGSGGESAATIIYKVARACGINPQVLLVLLQKETGIVNSSTPSSLTYRKAAGYGCPDTASCDANYYGFFNQVYNASWQFKKYQASPGGRGYVAGRWNTILWHPNGACGASNVYIENQATAGLYLYTPYRPNGPALANMYGLGDGCSSYGNRNFMRYFTDWFGNTQGGSSFVRSSDTGDIYLISGTTKHHVPTLAVYNTLSNLGTYRAVSPSYLTGYTLGTEASELIRDPLSGEVALAQSGSRHRFTSCGLISDWGFNCSNAIDLMPGQLAKLPAGGDVSSFFVVPGNSTTYYLNEMARFPVDEWQGVLRLNGGVGPWVGTMRDAVSQRYPEGKVLATPGTAIKSSSANDVFLVDGTTAKVRVPSMAMLSEYGLGSVKTVSPTIVAGYASAPADLTIVAKCDDSLVLVNSGSASALTANHGSGIATTNLAGITCSQLRGSASISGKVFVKSAADYAVYLVADGAARSVPAWGDVVTMNGGTAPSVATLSAATIAGFPRKAAVVAPNSLIKTQNDPTIYVTDGLDRKLKVDSFGTTDALGIRSWRTVPDSLLVGYPTAGSVLSRVVTCAGSDYFGADGTIYSVSASNPHGMPVTALASTSCATLATSASGASAKTFVKNEEQPTVYYIVGGQRRSIDSWSKLVGVNGGQAPTVLTVGNSELSSIPVGAPMP